MPKVLITGATSGIGEELTKLYAQQDWQVIACGRNLQKLHELQKYLPNIEQLSFDITESAQIAEAADSLVSSLDVVILNAGECEYIEDPMHFDSALFERIMRVNLLSVGYCLEYFLPKIRRGGRLAIVSSSASYLPLPKASAYGASKSAVNYLANTLRLELKKFEVGVSLICPGFVKTPLTDKNNFAMPMRVSADFAAKSIYFDIEAGKDEIHFPHAFTQILKLLSILPYSWWRRIASTLV